MGIPRRHGKKDNELREHQSETHNLCIPLYLSKPNWLSCVG